MLLIILIVAAIAVCAMLLWGIWVGIRMMQELQSTVIEVRGRLLPLMDKAEMTLDSINGELERIDSVVTRFESVTDRVTSTTNAVQEVVSAPMEVLTSVGTGLLGAVARWRRSRRAR